MMRAQLMELIDTALCFAMNAASEEERGSACSSVSPSVRKMHAGASPHVTIWSSARRRRGHAVQAEDVHVPHPATPATPPGVAARLDDDIGVRAALPKAR